MSDEASIRVRASKGTATDVWLAASCGDYVAYQQAGATLEQAFISLVEALLRDFARYVDEHPPTPDKPTQ